MKITRNFFWQSILKYECTQRDIVTNSINNSKYIDSNLVILEANLSEKINKYYVSIMTVQDNTSIANPESGLVYSKNTGFYPPIFTQKQTREFVEKYFNNQVSVQQMYDIMSTVQSITGLYIIISIELLRNRTYFAFLIFYVNLLQFNQEILLNILQENKLFGELICRLKKILQILGKLIKNYNILQTKFQWQNKDIEEKILKYHTYLQYEQNKFNDDFNNILNAHLNKKVEC